MDFRNFEARCTLCTKAGESGYTWMTSPPSKQERHDFYSSSQEPDPGRR